MLFLWAAAAATGLFGTLMAAAGLLHALRVRQDTRDVAGQVTLILPLTGPVPRLEALFQALAAQRLRPRRLIVAVESLDDPAAARASAAAALLPFPMRLVVAETSDTRGQKCTNLIAGFRQVDALDDAVVMLDGDILPQPWWLSTLAGPLLSGRHHIVTGYRWPCPVAPGALTQIVVWFDRCMATLPRLQRLALVWGGSLGFSRQALAVLDLPNVLDGALSDDLAIASAARRAGIHVLTRLVLQLPTPYEADTPGFMRRQMQIIHLCRPWLWRTALAVNLLDALGWAALLILAVSSPLALGLLVLLLGFRLLRWWLNDRLARVIEAPDSPANRSAQLWVALAAPVCIWLILALMLGAWPRRRIAWRHVTYALDGPDKVRVIRRDTAPPAPPCPVTGDAGAVFVQSVTGRFLNDLWRLTFGVTASPIPRDGTRYGLWRAPCGLVFFSPPMVGDQAFYGSLYKRWAFHETLAHDSAARVEFLEAATLVPPGALVLDVGAGTASFSRHVGHARYIGLEPYASHYDLPQGVEICTDTLPDHAVTAAGRYDVVCAFQVIEHVTDPRAMAAQMLACLKPGGLLILVAPLWPSTLTRVPNFALNAPPHHVTWWSEPAMAALAGAIGADVVQARPLPPTIHQGIIHWMARLSPVKPGEHGPWFQSRWSWHFGLVLAYLAGRVAVWFKPMPASASPMDVMLVARKRG
ncbi:methyltransferase domain-containing protein [Humitalea sp. 24SJ18S-53]|uniref:methyltransferase domain-containing protein n=1 Tax=Humitalea sp. 24SJ18S-53 TaxID=3422307 RepID=UPI003D66A1C3